MIEPVGNILATLSPLPEVISYVEQGMETTQKSISKVFIDLPRSMTLEKVEGFSQKAFFQKVQAVAFAALGMIYTFILYGGTVHLGGHGIYALGEALGQKMLLSLGLKVKKLGETIFLCGSVPLYATFYEAPKAIIKSIPRAVRFLAVKAGEFAQALLKHVLIPLWKNVFYPLGNWVFQNVRWGVEKVSVAIKALYGKIEALFLSVWNEVVIPVWNYIKPLGEKVIEIVRITLDKTVKFFQVIVTKIQKLVSVILENMIKPLWREVLRPLLKEIVRAFRWGVNNLTNILSAIAKKTANIASWIFEHLLLPIGKLVKRLGIASLRKTKEVASFVYKQVLAPVWRSVLFPILNKTWEIVDWTTDACLRIFGEILQRVASVASYIVRNFVLPVGKRISSSFYWVITETSTAVGGVWQKVSAATRWVFS